jgi:tetratricopeptide (TPR) repeat protein
MAAKKIGRALMLAALMLCLAACGGPEEKKVKFYAMAKEFYGKGDYTKARMEVKNAILIEPNFVEGYYLLGLIDQKDGNLKGASDAFSKAIELNPGFSAARVELGHILLASGSPEAALENAQTVLAGNPGDRRALILKGWVFMVQKKPKDAAAIFEGLMERGEKKPETYLSLATAYFRSGNFFLAEKTFGEGIGAYPEFVPLRLGLARFYSDSRQPVQAESELQQAIRLEPDQTIYTYFLSNHYLRQGRKQEAVTKLQAGIDASPKDPALYLLLAMIYERDQDYANAMQVYERVLTEDPDSWFAANNLAFLIAANKSWKAELDRAKMIAEKAIQQRPHEPALLDTLGWVYFRMGDTRRAHSLIEQALAWAPDDAVLNYHMGAVLIELGRKHAAREKLYKALAGETDFPGKADATRLLKELD